MYIGFSHCWFDREATEFTLMIDFRIAAIEEVVFVPIIGSFVSVGGADFLFLIDLLGYLLGVAFNKVGSVCGCGFVEC